jgi:hypothetical protein
MYIFFEESVVQHDTCPTPGEVEISANEPALGFKTLGRYGLIAPEAVSVSGFVHIRELLVIILAPVSFPVTVVTDTRFAAIYF